MKLMKNKSFRISIKIKLIIIKLLIGVGLIHPIKHDPHIEIEHKPGAFSHALAVSQA